MSDEMTFDQLTTQVKSVHEATSSYAKGAVNQLLTARNWAIGCYIVEYEQNGWERAEYGSSLLKRLAKTLNIKGLEHNQLNLCRMFYLRYPQIFSTASRKLDAIGWGHVATPFCLDSDCWTDNGYQYYRRNKDDFDHLFEDLGISGMVYPMGYLGNIMGSEKIIGDGMHMYA